MSLDIVRVGDPHQVTGPSTGSVKGPNEYKVTTTPLPPGARSANWRGYFNDQLAGPLVAFHDGNEITVYCEPDDEPDWLERVDFAIVTANEQESRAQYDGDT